MTEPAKEKSNSGRKYWIFSAFFHWLFCIVTAVDDHYGLTHGQLINTINFKGELLRCKQIIFAEKHTLKSTDWRVYFSGIMYSKI